MTSFEFLSVLLSCLAAIISLVVWFGQRKLQREANELQKFTAELSRKQLQLLKEQEHVKFAAKLSLRIVPDGNTHKLILKNVSEADAIAVELREIGTEDGKSILIPTDVQGKFPLRRMRPGDEVKLIVVLMATARRVHEFLVTWQNSDGSSANEEFSVSG